MECIAYPGTYKERSDHQERPHHVEVDLPHVWVARCSLRNYAVHYITTEESQRKPGGDGHPSSDVRDTHDLRISHIFIVHNRSSANIDA